MDKSYIEKEYKLAAEKFKLAATVPDDNKQWEARREMARLEAIASQCYGFDYADSLAVTFGLKPLPAGALGRLNMCNFKDDIEDLELDISTLQEVQTFLRCNRYDLSDGEIDNFHTLLENLHSAYIDFYQSINNLEIQMNNCTTRWKDENQNQ